MSSEDVVIDVRNLSKRFEIYATPRDRLKQTVLPRMHWAVNGAMAAIGIAERRPPPTYFREFWALNNVSFKVSRGETLGIIGRNGSGKSTLLQILAGTLAATSGEVRAVGRVAALLELGSGFNPEFTGRDNVFLNGRILGLTQKEIAARYEQITEFADIGDFIDQPVKTYSSGMFVRLAFAVQAHIDASIVIIDEALAVGDVFFRQKCYARLAQLRSSGAAIVLVSHSMPDIEQYCERAVLLDQGSARFIGPATDATKHYYLLNQSSGLLATPQAAANLTAAQEDQEGPMIERPQKEAFFDISARTQVGNGQARCIGVALCDANGSPKRSFRQGETAVFYYEFEITAAIGVPICGIVLVNDKNVIVHGKNSWQYDRDVAETTTSASKVICRQEVRLDLGPGEYSFEIGLAAISSEIWKNRSRVSHEEMSVRRVRVCHVPKAGSLSVGLAARNGVLFLTHHGLADLQGNIMVAVEPGADKRIAPDVIDDSLHTIRGSTSLGLPTVFHVTHWKAGSQWLYKILREIAPERIVPPQLNEKQFLEAPIVHGGIYPTVYVTREQFASVALPVNYRKFIIIRDLRDTLISGYFSIRYSHVVIDPRLARWREYLESASLESGLLMLIDEWLPMSSRIQESWIASGERVIRYEELLSRDSEILADVLIRECEIDVTPARLQEIVAGNRFEKLTGGRKSGVEDISAHERKGIAGDWRNYFTSTVTDRFKQRFGEILIATGYENSSAWGLE